MRQLLIESLILATLGCGAGLLLALWGVDLLVALNPGDIPRIDQVSLDGPTLSFALVVGFLTTLILVFSPRYNFQSLTCTRV